MKRILLPTVLAFVVISLSNAIADINYGNFNSTSGMSFVGNATGQNSVLRLTQSQNKVGAAWYTEKQQVSIGFETIFNFKISNNGTQQADGFAFVIQNSSQTAMGQYGGFLGYGKNIWNLNQRGISNSIAIEFDTYNDNPSWDPLFPDLPNNHISVQSGGIGSNSAEHTYSLGSSMIGFSIGDAQIHTAKINYLSNQLSVFVDNLQTPILTVPVNLNTLLNIPDGQAYTGFTAGTGYFWSAHDILNWSFTEVPEPATLSLLVIGAILLRRRK